MPQADLTDDLDLTTCEREAIHIPGMIQPHGVLLVLDPADWRVLQVSQNVDAIGSSAETALGATLDTLLAEDAAVLKEGLASEGCEGNPQMIGVLEFTVPDTGNGEFLVAIGHRIGGLAILELEFSRSRSHVGFGELYPLVQNFVSRMQSADTVQHLCELTVGEVRRITGFDRVLAYRFDPHWNGTVIAESRNDRLPSYLDLRFPASDIPAQARALYHANRLRLIADAEYTPVPLTPAVNPVSGEPLDMTHCTLRSVSPVHLQYMRNMGTASSMSISIMCEGELWGLISCHSAQPRRVSFEVRTACDLISQMLSVQIAARLHSAESLRRIELKSVESRLLSQMAATDGFVAGLVSRPGDLLSLTGATGAAVLHDRRCTLVGETPTEQQTRDLGEWLGSVSVDEVYHTDALPSVYAAAEAFADKASGLLSISISELHSSFVIWFRPEVIQTVTWGGDPRKPASPAGAGDGPPGRLNPRTSFEQWKQTVRNRSAPWSPAEVAAAADLRQAIVGIVLRKAEELAELTEELEMSNKDLEAFSYSVSHDLRAPFRHIVGYGELLREQESAGLSDRGRRYIDTIIESAQYAGKLVDNLLSFSRMNRTALSTGQVDLNRLVHEVRRQLRRDYEGRNIDWRVGELPTVHGDLMMLRLVLQNLISNAIKYSRTRDPAVITIESRMDDAERRWIICVRDNGVGFDMTYKDKLFGVFQRLHRMEDFEGTGIGLANVRRIIARHGGETWAEGEVDRGATFYFSLPATPSVERKRG
jgi:chemotaxis family two-component system sensor kinase Cph1